MQTTAASFMLGALLLAGCHTIRPVEPAQLTASSGVQRVWVTRTDQSTIAMDLPQVVGDTLTGMLHGEPQSIPLSDATVILARKAAPARTAVVVMLAGGLALAGFAYMESRPDVGDASYCGNAIGSRPAPFTSCCPAVDSLPC
ncbi:MAG TPA: hypothetical protein VLV45_13395 [Gemmatimonadales bacterium]|nr:hypothetical protein [Gemmatimonadales bacterium]